MIRPCGLAGVLLLALPETKRVSLGVRQHGGSRENSMLRFAQCMLKHAVTSSTSRPSTAHLATPTSMP